jgi:outer membrane receptor for ferrienterochelin and colicins
MIHNSVYDAPPVIPSLNAKFILSATTDLRLAYAKGFRAPSLRELYFNFFDANHQILGNPDLKAETSNSFTGSVSWKKQYNQHLTLSGQLSGYYNDVKNLIDYAVSQNDPNLYQFVNLAESKTRGISMIGSVTRPRWNASVGAAFTGFYNEYSKIGNLETIQWSPEMNMNFSYQFSKAGLDVNFLYKLTGKKPSYLVDGNQEIVLTKQKGYHLADLVLNKKFSRYFILHAGVKNIFDVVRVKRIISNTGIHTSGGALNIGNGRSLFAGLVFNWESNKNHK